MDIRAAVLEVLARDLSVPLRREELVAIADDCACTPTALYNTLLIEVSRRFLSGALSFGDADGVANDVWVSITSDMVDHGDGYLMPEPAFSIYEAFDAGEFGHGDGRDPVETFTRPELERVLQELDSHTAEPDPIA